jgi:hypothetical protein
MMREWELRAAGGRKPGMLGFWNRVIFRMQVLWEA